MVATSRSEAGLCLNDLPEISQALRGEYAAIGRRRVSDDLPPPVTDARRRGNIRIFTALPIFSDGTVIGVVRMSRTSVGALTSLWQSRRGLLIGFATSATLMIITSLLLSRAISEPLRSITRYAESIVRDESDPPPLQAHWAPREISSLQSALRTMTDKLRNRAEYVRQFTANVSHELKTPLTAIRGAAELLAEQWEVMPDDDRRQFIANIDHATHRMERLVAKLLHLARIENAEDPAEEIPVVDFFTRLQPPRWGKAPRPFPWRTSWIFSNNYDATRKVCKRLPPSTVRSIRSLPQVDCSIMGYPYDAHLVVTIVKENGWTRLPLLHKAAGLSITRLPNAY